MSSRVVRLKVQLLVTAAAFLAASSVAQAQATRTWVSGVGDDANPCSRTAPCKTFAGAISKTAAGGEINVLDPGGFGGVTITKSISIISEDFEAGVLVSGTNAIIINAGVNDAIVLKGLDIEGLNTGLSGIRFLAGATLYVQDCIIRNFQHGIDFQPSGNSKLFVDDTLITDNGTAAVGGGILVKPTATGTARAQIHNTRLQGNRFGLTVEQRGNATVTQSVASGNVLHGYSAFSTNAASGAVLALDDSPATHNVNDGVVADGVGAFVRISNMLIFANNIGARNNGGSLISWQNNRILGNLTAQTQGVITPQNQQ